MPDGSAEVLIPAGYQAVKRPGQRHLPDTIQEGMTQRRKQVGTKKHFIAFSDY
jgi:hypothetical protein